MSLTYDDIPGSWGIYSQNWPKLRCGNKHEADRAFVACTKENLVPYGSYVLMGNDLRVENEQLLEKLIDGIATSPFQSYHKVMMHYEKSYRNSYESLQKYKKDSWEYDYYMKLHFPHLVCDK